LEWTQTKSKIKHKLQQPKQIYLPAVCLKAKKKAWERQFTPCSFGLSATNQQQYFSLRTKQPSPTSQQYISLSYFSHQTTSPTDRLLVAAYAGISGTLTARPVA
jgi:hypothetical protein